MCQKMYILVDFVVDNQFIEAKFQQDVSISYNVSANDKSVQCKP